MFIHNALAETDTITVQDSNNTPDAPPAFGTGLSGMVPIILIFVVFYFLLIRPQEKRRQSQEKLVASVKKGEEVLTKSGLYGTVNKINDSDNTVVIQIAPDVEVKMRKDFILEIFGKDKTEKSKEKKKVSTSKKPATHKNQGVISGSNKI